MHMSIHMSTHISMHMSIHMSMHISMRMSMRMSMQMSMYMLMQMFMAMPSHQSALQCSACSIAEAGVLNELHHALSRLHKPQRSMIGAVTTSQPLSASSTGHSSLLMPLPACRVGE